MAVPAAVIVDQSGGRSLDLQAPAPGRIVRLAGWLKWMGQTWVAAR